MKQNRILIVEDEDDISDIIISCLESENMSVIRHNRGEGVITALQNEQIDLLILDLGLPDIDGIELLKKIREINIQLPILILSARKKTYYKICGLEFGADDYVTKPFCPDELIARVKAHLRRAKATTPKKENAAPPFIIIKDLKLDVKCMKLYKNNKELSISSRLLKLLQFFIENPDQVFSKEQLYNNVWDDTYYDDQTVMVYISELRKIIEKNPSKPEYIKTIRGFGYMFDTTT